MWSLGIPGLMFLILFTVVSVFWQGGEDDIEAQVKGELAMYRTFVSVADMHFKKEPAPVATTAYYWDQIKVSAPTGVAASGMNPTWKAVRKSDGSWAACTELKEVALASVGGLFPAPSEGALSSRNVDLGSSQVGVGVGSEEVANAAADLCKGA